MIYTAVTFTTSPPSAHPQSAAEEHSANFAQMLTNSTAQTKEQNIADNANSDIAQQENTLLAISDNLADETSVQIQETLALSDQPEFMPLTANQFIDQLPPQLAVVATSLRLEASQTSEQAITEQLTNQSENSAENLGIKKHPIALATSITHRPATEYPLANLAAPFTKPDTSPSQSLLQPISSSAINAATPASTADNSELFSVSPATNNNALPFTSAVANSTTLTHSMAPTTNAIALTTQIDQPEWGQKFSEQIVLLSRHGSQQAELRLHPEELGSLQIQLKIVDDKAQLSFVTVNQQVRQVIEGNLTQLRHALSEQGIELGQTHVGDQHQQDSHHDNQPATALSSITNEPHNQESDHSLTQIQQISQAQITRGINLFA